MLCRRCLRRVGFFQMRSVREARMQTFTLRVSVFLCRCVFMFLYLGVSANIENVLLSRSVDGIDLNRSIEVALLSLISKKIDFFVSFKTQILLLSRVSNWILNAVLSF